MSYEPSYGPESRFTAARPDCPNPEYWTSADGDSTEVEVSELVGAFVRALQPEYVLETGTAWGQTASYIARALRANQHGRLFTIENNYERVEYVRKEFPELLGSWMTVIWGESLQFFSQTRFNPQKLDFCWFDSLLELRAPEFRYFRPYMSDRCVVGFHDTGPQHSLRPSIDQLEREGLIAPMHLPTPRGVTFARVLP